MAKTSGLGDRVWISGVPVSGDVQTVALTMPASPLDMTGIDKSAHERILGLRDGKIALSTYFNSAAGGIHTVLKTLPRTDVIGSYFRGYGLGSPCASVVSVQSNYDPTRGVDGSLIFKADLLGDKYALDWGVQLTNGPRTDVAATNGTGVDGGNSFNTPAIPASLTPVTNTSPLSAVVVITGGTMTNVSVNGVTVGAGAGTYTVPPNGTITLTYTVAPTWTWSLQTAFGFQAFLHVSAFVGTDVTVKLQDSADNVTFADVASGAFAQITSGTPQGQRIAVGGTAVLRRYVRASTVTTGGFTSVTFVASVTQNLGVVTF